MVPLDPHSSIHSAVELAGHDLRSRATVVLVTDAGMPGISDPGGVVVDAVHDAGERVEVVPGPSAVSAALAEGGVGWIETGSPYAVTPGRIVTGQGTGFKVFTPFANAWRGHGWRGPAIEPDGVRLLAVSKTFGAAAVAEAAGAEGERHQPDARRVHGAARGGQVGGRQMVVVEVHRRAQRGRELRVDLARLLVKGQRSRGCRLYRVRDGVEIPLLRC